MSPHNLSFHRDEHNMKVLCWVANLFGGPIVDKQCNYCGRLLASSVACSCGADFCVTCPQTQHQAVCLGPLEEDHALVRLKVTCLKHEPYYAVLWLATSMILCQLVDNLDELGGDELDPDDESSIEDDPEFQELFRQSHELLAEIQRDRNHAIYSESQWLSVLRFCRRHLVHGEIPSIYAIQCHTLTREDNWTDAAVAEFQISAQQEFSKIEFMDEPHQCFPPAKWSGISTKLPPPHSCMPTHCTTGDAVLVSQYTTVAERNSESQGITISRIVDTVLDLEDRAYRLLQVAGISSCTCLRCRFERAPTAANDAYSLDELLRLLDFAKQQERYKDALDVAQAMLRLNATSAAAFWVCAQISGWLGQYAKREEYLIQGIASKCADDDADKVRLNQALVEAEAYYRQGPGDADPSADESEWQAIEGLEGDAFVGDCVLNPDECSDMVTAVEQYVCGDWTTSRHYAVPTTDVPVYTIPKLSVWFNVQLEHTIFPALCKQYEISGRLRMLDAFFAKYDAFRGQSRLPLHNDQSDYSLTIAMNDSCEGGGTYFADINDTIKTNVGGIVSFRGELVHAGTAIQSGVRYIIVCFIYEEDMPE